MKLRLLISLSFLLLSWRPVLAQYRFADDFFHDGAQSYITNNLAGARRAVDQGLQLYPDDIKLKKLDQLLKQQNQQQQSQDQKQDSKQQQQQQQQQQQNKSGEKKDSQQEREQPKKSSGDESKRPQPKNQEAESKPDRAGGMTPQEAKQLLDSQKNNELMLPVSRKEKPVDQQRPLKDW
jgi:hypothetical protein